MNHKAYECKGCMHKPIMNFNLDVTFGFLLQKNLMFNIDIPMYQNFQLCTYVVN